MALKHLVVGGDGLIGRAITTDLRGRDAEVLATSRRQPARFHLDLRALPSVLPFVEVAFLCAGVNGFAECEGNRESWRVNVDGVLGVVALLHGSPFLVYVSSGAVEWSGNAYARQRLAVETALRASYSRVAILRPEKLTSANVAQFAAFAVHIGQRALRGVYNWPRPALKEAS